ncbi:MAG: DoxX family membrane protein [Planctomycetes bacterium]|nr:DoxX family membrane protein [Planctomycetota bacterium]
MSASALSRAAKVSLGLQAALYVVAGLNHFRDPSFYLPMMPPYLPAHLELIYLSGVAEVVLGLGLIAPLTRRWAAWGIVALLIAVFPANLHIAIYNVPLAGAEVGAGALNWVRVPFQVPLLIWAWWFTRQRPASAEALGETAVDASPPSTS